MIEILFGESLLKILFATETFAMGINMPAKTVIFTACRKFDGQDFRPVSAGEYIQMRYGGEGGREGGGGLQWEMLVVAADGGEEGSKLEPRLTLSPLPPVVVPAAVGWTIEELSFRW